MSEEIIVRGEKTICLDYFPTKCLIGQYISLTNIKQAKLFQLKKLNFFRAEARLNAEMAHNSKIAGSNPNRLHLIFLQIIFIQWVPTECILKVCD